MNICRITSAFPPPWNGLAPGPYGLSLAQQGRGISVTVIARETPGAGEVDAKTPFPVERVPASYDIQFSLRASMRFKALESRGHRPFDIVHGHGLSALGFLISKKMGALSVPVVTTFHCVRRTQRRFAREALKTHGNGSEVKKIVPSRLRLACEAFQERLVAGGSDGLIAVSEEIRKNLIDGYGVSPGKVFMPGNGVDAALFSPAEKGPLNAGSRINLLWVG
ncbi:MAG: glycosyltransferase family 4 protein, partial [Deltaproteobacteria bacterium]|nr:glycosyltransferase family 4 protein [Deltaproteobacteria bacterium]